MVRKYKKTIKSGFTLIELIVVIAILVVISTISLNILITILRGSLKAEITKDVKQSGDYALNILTRMIRNAHSIESTCSGSSTSITIKNPDGGQSQFLCDLTNNYVSSTSAHLSPTPVPQPLTGQDFTLSNCSFNCQQTTGNPPVITVDFTLGKNTETFTRAEEKIEIDFHTKVALRSY